MSPEYSAAAGSRRGLDTVVNELANLAYDVVGVAIALADVFNQTAAQAAAVLKRFSYAVNQLADALDSAYQSTAAAAAANPAGPELCSRADLRGAQGRLQRDRRQRGPDPGSVLGTLDAAAKQIEGVLTDVFESTVADIEAILGAVGFLADAISSLGDAFTSFGQDIAAAFEDAFSWL